MIAMAESRGYKTVADVLNATITESAETQKGNHNRFASGRTAFPTQRRAGMCEMPLADSPSSNRGEAARRNPRLNRYVATVILPVVIVSIC